jgi:hypothetical protein
MPGALAQELSERAQAIAAIQTKHKEHPRLVWECFEFTVLLNCTSLEPQLPIYPLLSTPINS